MNKSITIIDFNHLNMRNLFIALSEVKPRKKDDLFITEEFIRYHKYLIFNSLQFIKNKFRNEIILASDSKNSWRKDFYTGYKANRNKTRENTQVNFKEFFEVTDEILDVIQNNFPFKVLKTEKAEADDIAGVISLIYGNEIDITLVTSDHDWLQVLPYTKGAKIWDPIKKVDMTLTDFENTIIETDHGPMSRFSIIHSLIGDKGDNIPSITAGTNFSEPFIDYLNKNNITNKCVKTVKEMNIFNELVENYNVFTPIKSGKLKGQHKDTKFIYKTVPFGIKKAEKTAESSETLNSLLNSHNMYRDNFIRNRKLVDFTKIPTEIKEEILKDFNKAEVRYSTDGMIDYFKKEELTQHINGINKFYSIKYEDIKTRSLDDFLSDF